MGFVAAGASIGGTVLPVTARNLLPHVGYVVPLVDFMFYIFFSASFAWTMRIFGFLLLIVLGAANLVNLFACFPLHIGLLKFCSS